MGIEIRPRKKNVWLATLGMAGLFTACSIIAALLIFYAPREQVAQASAPPQYSLKGGILLTLDMQGQEFRVFITHPETIRQLKELRVGESPALVISGRITTGAGESDYNAPYHWHIDPYTVRFVSASDKECNVSPSTIEANLDHYVKQVKFYCPSGAVIIKVSDFRQPLPNLLKGSLGSVGVD